MGKCRGFNCTRLCGQNKEASNVLGCVGEMQRLQMFQNMLAKYRDSHVLRVDCVGKMFFSADQCAYSMNCVYDRRQQKLHVRNSVHKVRILRRNLHANNDIYIYK
jgi:hypothetical protein